VNGLVMHNAPPDPPPHWQLMFVAYAGDFVVVFGFVMSLLLIRATARLVCTCDRGESA
jgi:hypothetical protein